MTVAKVPELAKYLEESLPPATANGSPADRGRDHDRKTWAVFAITMEFGFAYARAGNAVRWVSRFVSLSVCHFCGYRAAMVFSTLAISGFRNPSVSNAMTFPLPDSDE
jgi:hypothetical protein